MLITQNREGLAFVPISYEKGGMATMFFFVSIKEE